MRVTTREPVILIAEDEAIVALYMRQQLEANGYRVSAVASSAAAALEAARTLEPDLALIDIRLSGATKGTELAEELYICAGIPVVFVSAFSDPATLARAELCGAYGFITKPFTWETLHTTINVALAKHRELQRSNHQSRWQTAALGAIGVAVLVSDDSGTITYTNQAFESASGLQRVEVLGRSVQSVLGLPEPLEITPRERVRRHCEICWGGFRLPVTLSICPVHVSSTLQFVWTLLPTPT